MTNARNMSIRRLVAHPITGASFAPFGTLVEPTDDGDAFGPHDAQLELDRGRPRFYAMRLTRRPLIVERITRHRQVTQCLASTDGTRWILAVAPPGEVDDPAAEPRVEDIRCFLIPGGVAVALHRGTWHAGPYFEAESLSFFNLELADTNVRDHQSSDLVARLGSGIELVVDPA